MTNVIQFKRRVTGSPGAPAALKTGEAAINMVDDILYAGYGDDGGGNATSIVPIGGRGYFVDKTNAQTVGGVKTFSVSPVIPDGSSANHAASKGQMDTALALKANLASPTFTGTPAAPTPAAADNSTKIATTAFVQGEGFAKLTNRLDQFAAPTADVSMNSNKLTNLADPTSNQDAATKAYVDAAARGLDYKESVRAATTANITLSGTQTIDGVSCVAGNRVLVKNQSTGSQNGIYVVAAGAWSRATDADANAEVTTGMFTFVEEGTTNGAKQFVLTTTGTITVGTTALTFTQFGGGTSYTAGNGIGLSGSSFFVSAGAGLTQEADGLKISDSYAGQSTITTLGTVTTGTWNATIIGLAKGGSGADLSGAADGAIFKKSGSALVAATVGTDYLSNASTIDGGTF